MNKRRFAWGWHVPVLIGILLVSGILNFYHLNQEGYGNTYYAAAVKSMLQSWHNFFFVSFDPGGYITVDKPPVAFWLQTISAKIFGFKGWALLLPQALAAVASVAVLYKLVAKVYGRVAGLLAALFLAVSPVLVAVSRTNNVDSLLVFTLLVASWFLLKAVEKGQLRYLMYTAILVGIGFNIKMMQAYLILPAFFLLYVMGPPISWRKKTVHLISATAVLLAVSLSWSVVVDAIPADKRPYVGSSQTNSELELSLGYNGIQRWSSNGPGGMGFGKNGQGMPGNMTPPNGMMPPNGMGQQGGMPWQEGSGQQGNMNPPDGSGQQGDMNMPDGSGQQGGMNPPDGSDQQYNRGDRGDRGNGNWGNGMTPPNGMEFPNGRMGGDMPRGGFNGGGGAFNTGTPGVLRFFQASLSGQISWWFPLIAFGFLALLWRPRRVEEARPAWKHTLFWGAWLLPMMIFFSFAGFFHQYYLCMLAPGVSALAGAGLVTMWKDLRGANWRKWLLPVALVANAAFQTYIYFAYEESAWLLPSVGILTLVAVITTLLITIPKFQQQQSIARIAVITGLLSLLVAPTTWAATPMLYGGNETLPVAGPELKNSQMGGMMNMNVDSQLQEYLLKNYKPGSYLVATADSHSASSLIIQTGLPVMAMGGFSGSDPAMTADKLQKLAEEGKVKYFLLSGMRQSGDVSTWIQNNCQVVPATEYQSSQSGNGRMDSQLYEYVGK